VAEPALSTIPLFADIDAAELAELERRTKVKRYRKRTVIIEEGDESSTLYLLLSGRAKVYVEDDAGKELVVRELGPGDHFGELALLGGSSRTASVMSVEDCEVRLLSGSDFQGALTARPQLALHLVRNLARQVARLTDKLRDFGLLSTYQRITKVLVEAAVEEDRKLITPPMTQQELAEQVGCSREMVSRIIGDLRAGGYLSQEGKRFVLLRRLPQRW
jgi:CRP/FNR family cyclic AMP-dependent transcriptional regulator